MFFLELSSVERLFVRKVVFQNAGYKITIRHCEDLSDMEKLKFCTRDDSFLAQISGNTLHSHAEFYIDNDLQWHCDNSAIPAELITRIGEMIDNHFL